MRVIAVEEHFATGELLEADGIGGPGYPSERLLDLGERRIEDMDAGGVDLQVISLAAPGGQQLEAKRAVPLVRRANEVLAEAVFRHPDRFAGLAALPTPDPEAACAELERAVRELGFRGAVVNGHTRGRFLDAPEFRSLLELAAHLGVPIYLHPTPPPDVVRRAYYSGISPEVDGALATSAWGWHVETGLHALRLVLSGVFERLPDLRVVVGHLGEALPFMLRRVDARLSPEVTGLKRQPSWYLRHNLWLSISGFFFEAPFRTAMEEFGAERILFSVDYPFASSAEGRRFLEGLGFGPQEYAKIAHRNAEGLFGL